MGRKWYNNVWEKYKVENRIKFELTIPYAHQQNSITEYNMYTILDATQSIMAESGLPLKYWMDVIQAVIYVRNFISSIRQPKKILTKL